MLFPIIKVYSKYYLQSSKLFVTSLFYLIIPILFVLGLPSNSNSLEYLSFIANQLLLINLFLVFIYSLEDLFFRDSDIGILDLILINKSYIHIYTYTKFFFHYSILILPTLIIIPIIGLFLNHPITPLTFLSIIFSSLFLNSLGFFGSAISYSIKQRVFLLYLILFPFFIPILIFNQTIPVPLLFLSIFLSIISPLLVSYILESK